MKLLLYKILCVFIGHTARGGDGMTLVCKRCGAVGSIYNVVG